MSAVLSHYSDPEDFEYGDEAHVANDVNPQGPSESTEHAASANEASSMQQPQQISDDTETLKRNIKNVVQDICKADSDLNDFVSHYNSKRIITEVNQITKLFEKNCQEEGCTEHCSVVNTKSEGGVLVISWKCSQGHCGVWESSSILTVKRGQKVYALTVLLAASVIVTGNNFDKLDMLMKFLNVAFISERSFSRLQTTCAIPVVKELWENMKEKIWETLQGEAIVVAGDGRNDSPGHSAKYCVYTLMEHYLDIIVDLEVVDKRETGGSSATMEKLALKRLIERAMKDLKVVDLVTDASSMIIALIRTLKGQCILIIVAT